MEIRCSKNGFSQKNLLNKQKTKVRNKNSRNNSQVDDTNSKIATVFPAIMKIANNKKCKFDTVSKFKKKLSSDEKQTYDDLLKEQTAYSVLLDKALETIKALAKNISSNSNRRLPRVRFRQKHLKKASVNKVVAFFNKQNIGLKLIISKQNSSRTIVKFDPKDSIDKVTLKQSKPNTSKDSYYYMYLNAINKLIETKRFKEQKSVFLRLKPNSNYSSTFKSIFSQLKTHFENEGYELILQEASISVSEKKSKPYLLVRGDLSSFICKFQRQFASFRKHVAQTSLIKDKMVIAVEKQYYEKDELLTNLFFYLKGIPQLNIKSVLSVKWTHEDSCEDSCFSFLRDDKFLYVSIKKRDPGI